MALIWSEQRDGVNYEVRAAGRTRRLYTDGVFHSSYNPAAPVTGGVWDMLMMPAFFYPPGSVRRVLLLGVGGGTVIRQLREFVRPREIVAVDLNDTHLEIAQRFFGVTGNDVRLVHADARAWLQQDSSHYDLVIDDLFGECNGHPVRAIEADTTWCRKLRARTTRGGAVSINCISPAELSATGFVTDFRLRAHFSGRLQLRAERDRNAVGIFVPRPLESTELRRTLLGVPGLNPRRESRLNFTVRALK
ncbi:MAG: methyltransferase domain-containing protein [Proteobacteria bacterium]|nr:methyltransferase domain-containing protein [Pseudomonadota bacterium]